MILQSDVAHSGAKTDGNRYALNHCREPPSAKGSIHRLRRNKYVYYAAYTRANVLQLPLSEQFDGHEQRSKHVHDRRGGTGGGGILLFRAVDGLLPCTLQHLLIGKHG